MFSQADEEVAFITSSPVVDASPVTVEPTVVVELAESASATAVLPAVSKPVRLSVVTQSDAMKVNHVIAVICGRSLSPAHRAKWLGAP